MVDFGIDLTEFYQSVEWDILSVPAQRWVQSRRIRRREVQWKDMESFLLYNTRNIAVELLFHFLCQLLIIELCKAFLLLILLEWRGQSEDIEHYEADQSEGQAQLKGWTFVSICSCQGMYTNKNWNKFQTSTFTGSPFLFFYSQLSGKHFLCLDGGLWCCDQCTASHWSNPLNLASDWSTDPSRHRVSRSQRCQWFII